MYYLHMKSPKNPLAFQGLWHVLVGDSKVSGVRKPWLPILSPHLLAYSFRLITKSLKTQFLYFYNRNNNNNNLTLWLANRLFGP